MKELNLQSIAIQNMPAYEITEGVILSMKQACEDAINLCAENATTEVVQMNLAGSVRIVNKDSILNTKTQIK